jgi:proteic killer suppression protein
VIKDFKHKGLETFFTKGTTKGIQSTHANKLRMQLAMLNVAEVISDMDKPGWQLHELKGNRKHIWSIKVSGNWRLTFQFENGDAHIVNYEDYH